MPESPPSTLQPLGPGIFRFLELSFKNSIPWQWVLCPDDFEGVESDIRRGESREGGGRLLWELARSAPQVCPLPTSLQTGLEEPTHRGGSFRLRNPSGLW